MICRDYDGHYYVFEPMLVLKQTSRWSPLDRKLFSFSKNDWWNPLDWHDPRYSERDRVDEQMNLIDQFRDLDRWYREQQRWMAQNVNGGGGEGGFWTEDAAALCVTADYDGKRMQGGGSGGGSGPILEANAYTEVVRSLLQRRDSLQTLMNGSESTQYLPADLLVGAKAKNEGLPPALAQVEIIQVVPPELSPPPAGPNNATPETIQLVVFTKGMPKSEKGKLTVGKPVINVLPLGSGTCPDVEVRGNSLLVTYQAPIAGVKASAVALQLEMTYEVAGEKPETRTAISVPIPIVRPAVPAAKDDRFQPALKATISRDAQGNPIGYEFHLNPEMKEKVDGLENVIINHNNAFPNMKPSEMTIKAVPKP